MAVNSVIVSEWRAQEWKEQPPVYFYRPVYQRAPRWLRDSPYPWVDGWERFSNAP